MISEYHRPNTLDEAMKLIARADPCTYPLGGGTVLNRPSPDQFAVVDLQALGLNIIHKNGNNLEIGATATLQALLDSPHISPALQIAIKLETTFNLRQMATVAGTLVACDGRSPFAAVMLALDAKLTLAPNEEEITLGNLLPFLKSVGVGLVPAQKGRPHRSPALACTCAGTSAQVQACRPGLAARTGEHRQHAGARRQGSPLQGKLITKITIPLQPSLAFESIARTPADRPIVCAAVAQWLSGRTRLALGGYDTSPRLAMDGNEPGGVEEAARNAYSEAGDEWASAEYRSDIAAVLAKRCLDYISSETREKKSSA